ncbi:ADP-ribosylglycohydrolase family protein [Saccharopolyspora sp. NPDC047091]|uniref:ADP-ribosylglycohydrolase family protein n=1 Tax=Saccharopolyspora sp. NPDC047091 TaxID=3155924 RepID=UPI0033F0CB30
MNKIGELHYQWVQRRKSSTPFRPETRPEDSDYNLHYVDVEPASKGGLEYEMVCHEAMQQHPLGKVRPNLFPVFGARVAGSLLGGAIGDALGARVRADEIDAIRQRFGKNLVFELGFMAEPEFAFTEHTQLALFAWESSIRARVGARLNGTGVADVLSAAQHGAQRWACTQGVPWQQAAGPYGRFAEPDGWLVREGRLFSRRGDSGVVVDSALQFASSGVRGALDNPVRTARGPHALAGASAVALAPHDPQRVFDEAVRVAMLTHSSSDDCLPAGVFASVLNSLYYEVPFAESVEAAYEYLVQWGGHEETKRVLDVVRTAPSEEGEVPPARAEEWFGPGRSGAEVLGYGLWAAALSDYTREGILFAVNQSGDSAGSGFVVGALTGAAYGDHQLPYWPHERLELKDTITTLAHDAVTEFDEPPTDPTWFQRYPGW